MSMARVLALVLVLVLVVVVVVVVVAAAAAAAADRRRKTTTRIESPRKGATKGADTAPGGGNMEANTM